MITIIFTLMRWDLNSVLDDVSRNVNEDFGFDQALSKFREGQTNRKALEAV